MARFICWHIQEQGLGGLDHKTTKLLEGFARGDKPGDRPKRLKVGTVLVREYQGERHTVTVVRDGYVWRDVTYASLSTIARAITGTAWSGPRFFGVRGRPDALPLTESIDGGRPGRIDVVVVYKVDRLTRSLADFAKLVELFDRHAVSFVSITQSFNTTSSMGRLTLNVLLSFAQFEREVIGERVRDKIAASKRKGIWVGGPVPLGYRVVDKKVVAIPEEAPAVRTIFTRYLELGSIGALSRDLDRRGVRTKQPRLSAAGYGAASALAPVRLLIC